MSAPEATIRTETKTTVDSSPGEDHDGVLPEPTRTTSNILWAMGIGTLCIAILILVSTIARKALAPADATSDAHLGVLVALAGNLVTALVGFFVSQRRK